MGNDDDYVTIFKDREFLTDSGTSAIYAELLSETYGADEGPKEVYFNGEIAISDGGSGSFSFHSFDLETLASVAGKIAEMAMRLRNAALAARPEVKEKTAE